MGSRDVELGSLIRSRQHDLEHSDDGLSGDEEEDKGEQACGFRKAEGNHVLVYGKPRGKYFPWHCLMGPDWWCSLVTIVLILVPSFYALVLAAPTLHPLIGLGCFGTFLTLIISFTVTAFSDPGIIKKQTRAELEQSIRPKEGSLCERCHIYRPPMAYHCRDCDACIREHDHHCPWTGKCIGERNLTSFYIFIASLFVHFIYVVIVINIWLSGKNLATPNEP